jgi:hypothetical protein
VNGSWSSIPPKPTEDEIYLALFKCNCLAAAVRGGQRTSATLADDIVDACSSVIEAYERNFYGIRNDDFEEVRE